MGVNLRGLVWPACHGAKLIGKITGVKRRVRRNPEYCPGPAMAREPLRGRRVGNPCVGTWAGPADGPRCRYLQAPGRVPFATSHQAPGPRNKDQDQDRYSPA